MNGWSLDLNPESQTPQPNSFHIRVDRGGLSKCSWNGSNMQHSGTWASHSCHLFGDGPCKTGLVMTALS